MLMPWRALNRRHLATVKYAKGAERKIRRLAEEDMRESSKRAFQAYGEQLETVTLLTYLGQVLLAGDDDWLAVEGNLIKARKSLTRMTRILVQEEAYQSIYGLFLKVVVQVVLLFGSETWVLTPHMDPDLRSFQNRVAQQINGRHLRRWGIKGF